MMSDNHELAKQDYLNGMKYKDIATKYDVSLSTVKSWKARYWKDEQRVATTSKKVASKIKKVATPVVEELVANDELTDKQKQFCLYYIQRFNATWAYMKAYDVDYQTASSAGSRMLSKDKIKEQISELKKSLSNDLYLNAQDIIKEYVKQAFADIGDYVDFGSWPEKLTKDDIKNVTSTDEDGSKNTMEFITDKPVLDADGNEIILHNSYLYFKDKSEVDTSLIKSMRMGKDGPIVELYDKQKAMKELLERLPEPTNTNVEEDAFLKAINEGIKQLGAVDDES